MGAIFRGEEIDLSGKAKEEESDNTSEAADNNEHTAESNSTAKDNVTDNDNSADLNDVHDNNSNVDHDESDNNQNWWRFDLNYFQYVILNKSDDNYRRRW